MLYKPKNLIPSNKLQLVNYPDKNNNYKFSFQGEGNEKIVKYYILLEATNISIDSKDFSPSLDTISPNSLDTISYNNSPNWDSSKDTYHLYVSDDADKFNGDSIIKINTGHLPLNKNGLLCGVITLTDPSVKHGWSKYRRGSSLFITPGNYPPVNNRWVLCRSGYRLGGNWIGSDEEWIDKKYWYMFINKKDWSFFENTSPLTNISFNGAKSESIKEQIQKLQLKFTVDSAKEYSKEHILNFTSKDLIDFNITKTNIQFSILLTTPELVNCVGENDNLESAYIFNDSKLTFDFTISETYDNSDVVKVYLSNVNITNFLVDYGETAETLLKTTDFSLGLEMNLTMIDTMYNTNCSYSFDALTNNYLIDSLGNSLTLNFFINKETLWKDLNLEQQTYLTEIAWKAGYQSEKGIIVYGDNTKILLQEEIPDLNIQIQTQMMNGRFYGIFNPSGLNIETLLNYQWKLYQGTLNNDQINGSLIYQTPKIYSQDFRFEYDDLIPGNYVIEAIVEDNYGQTWSTPKEFTVSYESNDLYLNLQSELDKENTGVKLKWDKPEYGEINFGFFGISDNNFSIENGILVENGPGEKDISSLLSYAAVTGINLLEPLKNYISIKGSFNKWHAFSGSTSFIEDYDKIYYLGLLSSVAVYLCIQSNKNYLVLEERNSNIILTPIEIEQNLEKEDFLQGIEINIKNKSILIQYNDKFTDIDASNFSYFFEKVSGQYQISLSLENISTLDYIVASNDSMFDKDTNTWKNDDNLKWNPDDYSCLLTFLGDKPYSYLDPNANAQITGYNLKRYNPLTQKVLNIGQYYFTQPEGKLEFYFDNITLNTSNCIVGKIYSHPITEDLYLWNGSNLIPYTERRFVDYSLPHNEEVKYLIYPQGNETTTEETFQELAFSPVYSDSIKGDWDKWCLFTTRGPAPKNLDGTVDNGYNENVLLVDKIFFFEMNVETGNMKNNTDFSVIKNFTPYPHIQRSPSNYWSGQLKGLLGRLAIDDCTFKQTPTMLQEIKDLTQNTSRKFLKDRDGNFWEVELSSDITIDNNDKLDVQLKTKSFNWVEVGDASGIALVSVGPGHEEWLLTELGKEQIDISRYTWDDNAIWDENDFWTESE